MQVHRFQVSPIVSPARLASSPSQSVAFGAPGPQQPSALRQATDQGITNVLASEKRLDEMLQRASRGGAMSQRDLLQLQVAVYDCSLKVDVATKVVDKSAGALRQLLTTQV